MTACRSSALFVVVVSCATATSVVRSCGGPSDHLKDASFSVSPDPMEQGKPFTLELSGNLDEDLTEVIADVDLDVDIHFLSFPSHQKINTTTRISGKPKITKGQTKIVVGPFVLNAGWISVSVSASGTVKLRDSKGEAVACLSVQNGIFGRELSTSDVKMVGAGESQPADLQDDTQDCGTPNDHIKNLVVNGTNTTTNITFDLDEPLNNVTMFTTNKISKFFFSDTISATTPFTYSPGFPAGRFEWKIESLDEPSPAELDPLSAQGLSLDGMFRLKDGKGELMYCLKYQESFLDAVIV